MPSTQQIESHMQAWIMSTALHSSTGGMRIVRTVGHPSHVGWAPKQHGQDAPPTISAQHAVRALTLTPARSRAPLSASGAPLRVAKIMYVKRARSGSDGRPTPFNPGSDSASDVPAMEEPAMEEPAMEEPAMEEPAAARSDGADGIPSEQHAHP